MEIRLRLDAVIVAVTDDQPRILTVRDGEGARPRMPSASIGEEPTLERSIRRGIQRQTGLDISYVEQLYTFGDLHRRPEAEGTREVTVAYLALVQETELSSGADWLGYYDLLPWEDHRDGAPEVVVDSIVPQLREWAGDNPDRRERLELTFLGAFDGVRALERYELLYEAGLVAEAWADRGARPPEVTFGDPMHLDGRRIAATALARLRGKLSYRPVVFDVLHETFTLLELQRCVEALAGVALHKQNFRRLVDRLGLVEGTGEQVRHGGRPAETFRYRREVQLERSRPGVGQPYR